MRSQVTVSLVVSVRVRFKKMDDSSRHVSDEQPVSDEACMGLGPVHRD